jgi:hypothetical protein
MLQAINAQDAGQTDAGYLSIKSKPSSYSPRQVRSHFAARSQTNLPRISCTRINKVLVRFIRGKSCQRLHYVGQDFPRGVPACFLRYFKRGRTRFLEPVKARRSTAFSSGSRTALGHFLAQTLREPVTPAHSLRVNGPSRARKVLKVNRAPCMKRRSNFSPGLPAAARDSCGSVRQDLPSPGQRMPIRASVEE